MTRNPRILLVGNTDHSMIHFRHVLLRRLVAAGYDVHVAVPDGPHVPALEAIGLKVQRWQLARRSTNPLRELLSLAHLARIHRRVRPDIAHYFSLKPALYGPVAARFGGTRRCVASITGLGYVFTEDGARVRLLRTLVLPFCRLSFTLADEVLFQNEEDYETIRAAGALPAGRGLVMHGGEGVDASFFDPDRVAPEAVQKLREELRIEPSERVVVLVARILGHKGVREYAKAARTLKGRARFLLIGPIDTQNPSAIPEQEVRAWQEEGVIEHLGERHDVRELLALADVAVLPSYREGTSQFLLEASSMARAIVATDVPGCRVVVEHGRTGLLVPARDAARLTAALDEMLAEPALRQKLASAARQRVLASFDVVRVVERLFAIYARLGGGRAQEPR